MIALAGMTEGVGGEGQRGPPDCKRGGFIESSARPGFLCVGFSNRGIVSRSTAGAKDGL